MIKYLTAVLIPVLFVSCTPVQVAPTVSVEKDIFFARQWNVAVLDLNYEFEEEGAVSLSKYKSAGKNGGRVVAGLLAGALAEMSNLTIIERTQITRLLDEQALQQSGVIDTETAKKVGRLTGADAVVVGDLTDYLIWEAIGSYGSTISFSIRIIDVQSGRILANAAISRVRTLVDSFANVQLTAAELVKSIKQQ